LYIVAQRLNLPAIININAVNIGLGFSALSEVSALGRGFGQEVNMIELPFCRS
jgi:hypothetical protein